MKNNCPVLSGSWIESVGRVASLLRPPFNLFALSLIACLATAFLRFLRLPLGEFGSTLISGVTTVTWRRWSHRVHLIEISKKSNAHTYMVHLADEVKI